MGNLGPFPKTLIISAEYDFLRIQDEVYVKQLVEANVEVRYIQYGRMGPLAVILPNHTQLLGNESCFFR